MDRTVKRKGGNGKPRANIGGRTREQGKRSPNLPPSVLTQKKGGAEDGTSRKSSWIVLFPSWEQEKKEGSCQSPLPRPQRGRRKETKSTRNTMVL